VPASERTVLLATRTATIRFFPCIYVDTSDTADYKNATDLPRTYGWNQAISPNYFILYGIFFGAGPHECQIGSGEEIRIAVRKTFLS
jgi:hypothetical protein